MKNKITGILFTVASAVLFGLNPLITKSAYAAGSNSVMVTYFRMVFTGLMMWIFYRFTSDRTYRMNRKDFRKAVICAQGYVLTPVLLFSSYNYIGGGLASTLHFAYPIMVLIMSVIFFRQKLGPEKIAACLVAFLGIILLGNAEGEKNSFGFFLALVSAATFAFYVAYLGYSGLLKTAGPIYLASFFCLMGAIELLPLLLAGGFMVRDLSLSGWLYIVLFSIVNGCLASTFFQIGTKLIGAPSASMLSTFEPLTGVAVGVLVYHEIVTGRSVIGIVLVLAAVLLVAYSDLKTPAS